MVVIFLFLKSAFIKHIFRARDFVFHGWQVVRRNRFVYSLKRKTFKLRESSSHVFRLCERARAANDVWTVFVRNKAYSYSGLKTVSIYLFICLCLFETTELDTVLERSTTAMNGSNVGTLKLKKRKLMKSWEKKNPNVYNCIRFLT